jgi:hypothetical protein
MASNSLVKHRCSGCAGAVHRLEDIPVHRRSWGGDTSGAGAPSGARWGRRQMAHAWTHAVVGPYGLCSRVPSQLPGVAGPPSSASAQVRPAASRRRAEGRPCRQRVGSCASDEPPGALEPSLANWRRLDRRIREHGRRNAACIMEPGKPPCAASSASMRLFCAGSSSSRQRSRMLVSMPIIGQRTGGPRGWVRACRAAALTRPQPIARRSAAPLAGTRASRGCAEHRAGPVGR